MGHATEVGAVTEAEMWRAMREAQLELEAAMVRLGVRFTPLTEIEAKRKGTK